MVIEVRKGGGGWPIKRWRSSGESSVSKKLVSKMNVKKMSVLKDKSIPGERIYWLFMEPKK